MLQSDPQGNLFWVAFIVLGMLHLLFGRVPTSALRVGWPAVEGRLGSTPPIEVEKYVDSNKPVVTTSRAPEDPLLKDKEARFAGEFRNRVEQETHNPRTGRFQEGGAGKSGTPDPAQADPSNEAGEPGVTKRHGNLGMSDLMPFGASPHRLPDDIAEGSETLLNTDSVRYAGFINRIADEVYDPWVRHARDAVTNIYQRGKKLEANIYITKIQVVMDEKGSVTAIQTLGSSGIPELDDAPKKAFWEAEPFPNPPSQMFGKEGVVRFVYEFHFEWRSSSFNIVPWQI